MKYINKRVRLLGPAAMILFLGCAPAYHDYAVCIPNCEYCVPPPLPFRQYDDCACHSDVALKYLMTVEQEPVSKGEEILLEIE